MSVMNVIVLSNQEAPTVEYVLQGIADYLGLAVKETGGFATIEVGFGNGAKGYHYRFDNIETKEMEEPTLPEGAQRDTSDLVVLIPEVKFPAEPTEEENKVIGLFTEKVFENISSIYFHDAAGTDVEVKSMAHEVFGLVISIKGVGPLVEAVVNKHIATQSKKQEGEEQ